MSQWWAQMKLVDTNDLSHRCNQDCRSQTPHWILCNGKEVGVLQGNTFLKPYGQLFPWRSRSTCTMYTMLDFLFSYYYVKFTYTVPFRIYTESVPYNILLEITQKIQSIRTKSTDSMQGNQYQANISIQTRLSQLGQFLFLFFFEW